MDADDWHPFAKIVRLKWEARQALISLDKARMAIETSGEVKDSLDTLRGLADSFSPQETPIRSYTDLFETMEAGHGALPLDKANNLPVFGVDPLDRAVGAMAGTLGVVAAKTSAGKSSLAYQIAVRSALRGRRVCLVSLEADREEVSAAMAANVSERNRGQLLRTGLGGVEVSGIIKANVMGYHAGSGATWDQIEKAVRVEHRKNPFQVIILDYFTLLEPPSYKGNRNMASLYGEISKAGKRLAQQLNCSVIFLSQFNRGIEDGQEPFLENLRETGQLEQDADWVVLLWAKAEDEPEGFRYVNAKIAKNRRGKRGEKFRMKLFPAEARFIISDTEVENMKPRRRA
jgi:replicative DNA helicase